MLTPSSTFRAAHLAGGAAGREMTLPSPPKAKHRGRVKATDPGSSTRADIQIWTVGTGGGHRSVARALSGALLEHGPGDLRVAVDDPTELAGGRLARRLAGAYGPLVRRSPAAWGLLYRGFSQGWASSALDHFLSSQLAPAMAERIRARTPRVVVTCHPLLGAAARCAVGAAAGPSRTQLATVVTDLVGGHPAWLSAAPRVLITATPEASAWCRSLGAPAESVVETGLPIDQELAAPPLDEESRRSMRSQLGLDPDLTCVLLGGGAEGVGAMRRLTTRVARAGIPIQMVVVCGRNRGLLAWLRERQLPIPVTALDYQETLTPWLRVADVYLGKAGPSTVAEAAACGLALVLTGALPGQEEHNEDVLVRAGAGIRVRRRAPLLRALARIADPGDPLLRRMQLGARSWSRPEAAADAAEELLKLL